MLILFLPLSPVATRFGWHVSLVHSVVRISTRISGELGGHSVHQEKRTPQYRHHRGNLRESDIHDIKLSPTIWMYAHHGDISIQYNSEKPMSELDEKLESDLEERRFFRQIYRRTCSSTLSFRDKFCFDMHSNEDGFYLAIRDRTSCILLSNMLVYRHECEEKRVGLVNFLHTASASTRTRTVEAQCIENAESSFSLQVHCRSDGTWTDTTPECQCKPRYREMIDEEDNKHCVGTFYSF